MTRVRDVHHLDAGPESFTKGTAVLGRSNAVLQTLHDEKCYVVGWLHPVVLRRRTICCALGGGRRRPALHLTKNLFCRCRIGDECFGRLGTVGLGRVHHTKPRLQRPDDFRRGFDESDSGEQDHATDKIRTIHGQALCHSSANAMAEHVHRARTKRFDDRSDVGSQGMQRQALQPPRACASPAWVNSNSTKPGARNAPGQALEIRRIKPATWNQDDGIAGSIAQEFDPGVGDFNIALR